MARTTAQGELQYLRGILFQETNKLLPQAHSFYCYDLISAEVNKRQEQMSMVSCTVPVEFLLINSPLSLSLPHFLKEQRVRQV